MQPPSLQQTLAAVESLNKPDQAFSYRVEGNQIIGEWKYLDATWMAPLAAGNVDKDFRITISFDEASNSYTSKDHQTKTRSTARFNPANGQITFGKSTEMFSGQMAGKEMGFSFGHAKQPQNETSIGGATYQYNFATSAIKEPLFNFLAQQGWQKAKTSFLGKLFGG